jgi:hypothetical protein
MIPLQIILYEEQQMHQPNLLMLKSKPFVHSSEVSKIFRFLSSESKNYLPKMNPLPSDFPTDPLFTHIIINVILRPFFELIFYKKNMTPKIIINQISCL